MMRLFIVGATILTYTFACADDAHAALRNFSEAREALMNVVAMVLVGQSNKLDGNSCPEAPPSYGTAFLVAKEASGRGLVFATANHVVEYSHETNNGAFLQFADRSCRHATISTIRSRGIDLAFLRIDDAPDNVRRTESVGYLTPQ